MNTEKYKIQIRINQLKISFHNQCSFSFLTPHGLEATSPPSPIQRINSSIHRHSFSGISKKLDSKNYILWCQQVKPVVKAHKFFLKSSNTSDIHFHRRCKPQSYLPRIWTLGTTRSDPTWVVTIHHFSRHFSSCHWLLWGQNPCLLSVAHCIEALSTPIGAQAYKTGKLQELNLSISEFLLRVQSLNGSISTIGEPISPQWTPWHYPQRLAARIQIHYQHYYWKIWFCLHRRSLNSSSLSRITFGSVTRSILQMRISLRHLQHQTYQLT